MQLKNVLMLCFCAAILSGHAAAHSERYLIRRFYDITPGMQVRELQIGLCTYDVLDGGWKSGDLYCIPAPRQDTYWFLSDVSDALQGRFAQDDVYLNLYYTRKPLSLYGQKKKPCVETMQYK